MKRCVCGRIEGDQATDEPVPVFGLVLLGLWAVVIGLVIVGMLT